MCSGLCSDFKTLLPDARGRVHASLPQRLSECVSKIKGSSGSCAVVPLEACALCRCAAPSLCTMPGAAGGRASGALAAPTECRAGARGRGCANPVSGFKGSGSRARRARRRTAVQPCFWVARVCVFAARGFPPGPGTECAPAGCSTLCQQQAARTQAAGSGGRRRLRWWR